MSTALDYIYYIYDKFINLIFNTLELFPNVTIGWIAITIFVFNILFKNVLALPNKANSISTKSNKGNKGNSKPSNKKGG